MNPVMPERATNEQIIDAYKATGSVWKAGMRLGICGQSVHERLRRLGYPTSAAWTGEEVEVLRTLAQEGFAVGQIAQRLGRTYAAVACKIHELHIAIPNSRKSKIPRGVGLSKKETISFARTILKDGLTLRKAANMKGVHATTLANALQQHTPEQWAEYVRLHTVSPPQKCPGCGNDFTPLNARQKACSGKCTNAARRDAEYFGGRRLETIGLREGVCQVCERANVKGLSSHHIFGKENDPDNDFLIALCPGCHHLVGTLGSRSRVGDPQFWENLISLAIVRSWADKGRKALGTHVTVEIEELDQDDLITDSE